MLGNPEAGSNVHLYRDSITIHVRQALMSNPKAFARVGSANPTGCSHLHCHHAGRSWLPILAPDCYQLDASGTSWAIQSTDTTFNSHREQSLTCHRAEQTDSLRLTAANVWILKPYASTRIKNGPPQLHERNPPGLSPGILAVPARWHRFAQKPEPLSVGNHQFWHQNVVPEIQHPSRVQSGRDPGQCCYTGHPHPVMPSLINECHGVLSSFGWHADQTSPLDGFSEVFVIHQCHRNPKIVQQFDCWRILESLLQKHAFLPQHMFRDLSMLQSLGCWHHLHQEFQACLFCHWTPLQEETWSVLQQTLQSTLACQQRHLKFFWFGIVQRIVNGKLRWSI